MPVVWSAVGACMLPHVGGLLGSIVVQKNYESWYMKLEKPKWNPPRVIFPIAWTTIYTSMGYASYLVWRDGGGFNETTKLPLALYGTQLALNWAWAPIFFGFHSFKWAAIEGWLCYGAVIATTASFYQVSTPATYLMVPYVVWMTFASMLGFNLRKANEKKSIEEEPKKSE